MSLRLSASVILMALAGLSLGACRRERPAPVVLTVASGTEPVWSVEVRSDLVQFSRPAADSAFYPYTPPVFDADGRAIYRSKRFGADPLLTLVIERSECRDGASERRYPGSAVLTRGDSTWRGCATVVPDSVEAR
jgi:uncharacterized membrane protein